MGYYSAKIKEWNDAYHNIHEPRHYAKWNTPDIKRPHLYVYIYMKYTDEN
jgi:hypothetical protein